MNQGDLLKKYGLDHVEDHNPEFVALVRGYARQHSVEFGSVTSDVCRLWANNNKIYPLHHNAWGAVFRVGFERIGFTKSLVPSNHSRIISIWKHV